MNPHHHKHLTLEQARPTTLGSLEVLQRKLPGAYMQHHGLAHGLFPERDFCQRQAHVQHRGQKPPGSEVDHLHLHCLPHQIKTEYCQSQQQPSKPLLMTVTGAAGGPHDWPRL
jgi:hypothetical protein